MRPSDDRRLLTEFSDAFINGADVCRWQCKRIRFEPGAEVGADFDGAGVGRLRYSGIEDDVTRFNAFDVETQGFIRAEPGKRAYGQIWVLTFNPHWVYSVFCRAALVRV